MLDHWLNTWEFSIWRYLAVSFFSYISFLLYKIREMVLDDRARSSGFDGPDAFLGVLIVCIWPIAGVFLSLSFFPTAIQKIAQYIIDSNRRKKRARSAVIEKELDTKREELKASGYTKEIYRYDQSEVLVNGDKRVVF